MSDLLVDKNSILMFDIDGVLCKYWFKDYNTKCFEDIHWARMNVSCDMYAHAERTHLFDDIIEKWDAEKLYTLSTATSSFEQRNKIHLIKREFPKFKDENILFVGDDKYKVGVMSEFWRKYPKHDVILIEDSASILASVVSANNSHIKCYLVSDFI